MAANSTDHSTEFATYTETPINKSNGWIGWLVTLGVIFGLLCICSLCVSMLLGTSIVTINRRVATAVAPFNATSTVFTVKSTSAAKSTATARANLFATATLSAQWPTIINSTFDLNIPSWTTGASEDEYGSFSRRVADGKYQWYASALKGVHIQGQPIMPSVSDFHLSVEAHQISGPQSAAYGVAFRIDKSSGYYYFAIRDSGEYLFALRDNNQWMPLIGWTYNTAIQAGQMNRIAINAEGPRFTFYINDLFIAEFTDATISSGIAGLAIELNAGDTGNFEFDNFDLRAPVATATENPAMAGTVNPTSTLAPTLALTSNEHIVFVRGGDLYLFTGDILRLEKLNTSRFSNTSPAWSPDGEQIAFSARSFDAQFDIYTLKLDGSGELAKLTTSTGSDYSPAWSPDGKYVAFVSDRDNNYEIYVMNADGSAPTRITKNTSVDDEPTWSPDSAHIAFTVGDDNRKIYIMNADGSDVNPLMENSDNDDANPAWSPDGSKIVFTSNRDGNYEIYIVNIDGTGLTRVTNNVANDTSPVWSLDGKYIAFVSDRTGNKEIYVMNVDGTNPTQLTNSPADDLEPAWRP